MSRPIIVVAATRSEMVTLMRDEDTRLIRALGQQVRELVEQLELERQRNLELQQQIAALERGKER